MPPPLTLTTLALSPTGAIALDTPVKADSTNGTFSTLTSLFIATTPCCGVRLAVLDHHLELLATASCRR